MLDAHTGGTICVQAAVDAQCTSEVPCAFTNYGPPSGSSTQSLFYFMATIRELVREAVLNIVIALVVSYVVLVVATRNVIIPALAVLSIGSTVTWVLAMILALGHRFDANAAILVVMATGMAVDYAVHLAHFYNDGVGTRYQKTQAALHGVGLSVCGGALTTAGAAIPLCFSLHFLFFEMAGAFILSVAIFGLFFSFCMLVPLLMIVGPTGAQGDLQTIFDSCTGICRSGKVPSSTTL